ncbi:DNA polymerase I, partial [Acidithiobacillus sp. VAN18-1]
EAEDCPVGHITLASNDRDWWQALGQMVDWFSPITDTHVTLEDMGTTKVKDGPFKDAEEYLLAKAMAGDDSDNIPGVPGVGLKTAVKLLRMHGGLDGICSAVQSGVAKDKKSADIAEHHEIILRNLRIMDWRQAPDLNIHQFGVLRETFDAGDALLWCDELGLGKLADRLKDDGEWARRVRGWPAGDVIDLLERGING